MATHPIARALRINSPTIAMLTTAFEAYSSGAAGSLPFWTMAAAPADAIHTRTQAALEASGAVGTIVDGESLPGAGSVPGLAIPTPVLRLGGREEHVWRSLADYETPVIAARRDGAALVNLRSVHPDEDLIVAAALAEI
jgi:seryl-tRNA(Sec) selenium transferase